LGVVLALAIVARILAFNGYAGSDDGSYAELAHLLATGEFRVGQYAGPPVFPLRVGIFAPVALGFKLFGPAEWVMLAYPFIVSLATALLAFFAARAFFGETAGFIAGLIHAVLPLAASAASTLMVDLPAAFWGNLGVLLLVYGSHRKTPGARALCGSFSGLAFGASWLCKEAVVYLFPFAAGYCVWLFCRDRRNLALVGAAAVAAAFVFLTEALVYRHYTGDALYRLHETHRNYEYNNTWFFAEGSRFGWQHGEYHAALLKRLFLDGPMTIFGSRSFGGVTAIAALAVAYAAFTRVPLFLLPSLWFASQVLMFNFASSSLNSYQPLVLFDKYLYPLIFPASMLCAGLLTALLRERPAVHWELVRERRFWGSLVAVVLAGACALGTAVNVRTRWKSRVERALAPIVAPTDRLYSDKRTIRVLTFFWRYPEEVSARDFQGMDASDIPPGSMVLINHDKLDFLKSSYDYAVPAFCEDVPPHWTPKRQWKTRRAVLYEVGPDPRGGA
jgi:4-amino-4-deoxy-L-arabinose transferase-like glycosyltransferase